MKGMSCVPTDSHLCNYGLNLFKTKPASHLAESLLHIAATILDHTQKLTFKETDLGREQKP